MGAIGIRPTKRWMVDWRTDALVMRHSVGVMVALAAWLVWCGYTVYIALSVTEPPAPPGYLVGQLLLNAALFGRFTVVLVGAFLGSRDDVWNTWGLRITNWHRIPLVVNRILLLWVACGTSVVVLVGAGALADSIAGIDATGPLKLWTGEAMVTLGQLVVWVTLAFAVASLSRSLAAGAGGVIAYGMLELLLQQYIPQGLLRVLPGWNGSIVLRHVFPVQDGFLSIVTIGYGPVLVSALVLVAYLMLSIGVSVAVAACRSY